MQSFDHQIHLQLQPGKLSIKLLFQDYFLMKYLHQLIIYVVI